MLDAAAGLVSSRWAVRLLLWGALLGPLASGATAATTERPSSVGTTRLTCRTAASSCCGDWTWRCGSSTCSGGVADRQRYIDGLSGGPYAATRRPADIVLVLDASDQMAGEPLHQARLAALGFIDSLYLVPRGPIRVAVIRYSAKAAVLSPLTSDRARLSVALKLLRSSGGSCLGAGYSLAGRVLIAGRSDRGFDRDEVIILLSGSRAPREAPSSHCSAAPFARPATGEGAPGLVIHAKEKADRYGLAPQSTSCPTTFTVCLAPHCDSQAVRSLASSALHHIEVPEPAQLPHAFRAILRLLPARANTIHLPFATR